MPIKCYNSRSSRCPSMSPPFPPMLMVSYCEPQWLSLRPSLVEKDAPLNAGQAESTKGLKLQGATLNQWCVGDGTYLNILILLEKGSMLLSKVSSGNKPHFLKVITCVIAHLYQFPSLPSLIFPFSTWCFSGLPLRWTACTRILVSESMFVGS